MDRALDQDARLALRTLLTPQIRVRQRRGGAPGVGLAAELGEARVGEVEAAVLVDLVRLGWRSEVEGVAADGAGVVERDGARDERELVRGDGGADL